jgi:hypothetical protein
MTKLKKTRALQEQAEDSTQRSWSTVAKKICLLDGACCLLLILKYCQKGLRNELFINFPRAGSLQHLREWMRPAKRSECCNSYELIKINLPLKANNTPFSVILSRVNLFWKATVLVEINKVRRGNIADILQKPHYFLVVLKKSILLSSNPAANNRIIHNFETETRSIRSPFWGECYALEV